MQNAEHNMLVSIITVCFNAAETIETTIKSVVSQTYKNIEYIIIDGGSTDGTLQILERYRKDIAVIVSEKDEGIYDAMNKGIDLAKGDYIGIINADDWYEKDAVEKIVRIDQNLSKDIGVISGQIRFIDGNESFLSSKKEMSDIWIEMPVAHPATFIKKSIYEQYGKYSTHLKIAADYDFIFRLYISHVGFYLLDEILANFRIGGISSIKKNILLKEDTEILKRYQKYCIEPEKVQKSIRRKENIQLFYQAGKSDFCKILGITSERNESVFIFGCGFWGREFARLLVAQNITIRGFLDNNSALWGSKLLNHTITAPDVLQKQQHPKVVIAIQGDTLSIEKQIEYLNGETGYINLEAVFEQVRCIYEGDMD